MFGTATLPWVTDAAASRCLGTSHSSAAEDSLCRIASCASRSSRLPAAKLFVSPRACSRIARMAVGALPAGVGVCALQGREVRPCSGWSSSSSNCRVFLKSDTALTITAAKRVGNQTRLSRSERKRMATICPAVSPATSSSTAEKVYDFDSPKMKELVAFLEKDLVHLFDEQGIDRTMYDEKVQFRDPITKYERLSGYLFNIQMLRTFLTPKFELHSAKQTAPSEITTRWTMTMYFRLLPWKPELIFTGTSVMSVNEETGKFCSHVDYWDSIQNNEYFSTEAVGDLLRQMQIYKTPDLETPKYKVLKRPANYEVRQYEQFLVAETPADNITGNKGFKEVAGYLFGKNSTSEKMKMTTPVFNQTSSGSRQLQFVLPLRSQLGSVPTPLSELVNVRPVEKTYAAVIRFNGNADEQTVVAKEKILRDALTKDGLQQQTEEGFLLARYNDPGNTWAFMRRNEVIIWLKDFTLETE